VERRVLLHQRRSSPRFPARARDCPQSFDVKGTKLSGGLAHRSRRLPSRLGTRLSNWKGGVVQPPRPRGANRVGATAADIMKFAAHIREGVEARFDIGWARRRPHQLFLLTAPLPSGPRRSLLTAPRRPSCRDPVPLVLWSACASGRTTNRSTLIWCGRWRPVRIRRRSSATQCVCGPAADTASARVASRRTHHPNSSVRTMPGSISRPDGPAATVSQPQCLFQAVLCVRWPPRIRRALVRDEAGVELSPNRPRPAGVESGSSAVVHPERPSHVDVDSIASGDVGPRSGRARRAPPALFTNSVIGPPIPVTRRGQGRTSGRGDVTLHRRGAWGRVSAPGGEAVARLATGGDVFSRRDVQPARTPPRRFRSKPRSRPRPPGPHFLRIHSANPPSAVGSRSTP